MVPLPCSQPNVVGICFSVSEEERKYITSHQSPRAKIVKIPWKAIVTSWPVAVLTINQFSLNWFVVVI